MCPFGNCHFQSPFSIGNEIFQTNYPLMTKERTKAFWALVTTPQFQKGRGLYCWPADGDTVLFLDVMCHFNGVTLPRLSLVRAFKFKFRKFKYLGLGGFWLAEFYQIVLFIDPKWIFGTTFDLRKPTYSSSKFDFSQYSLTIKCFPSNTP